MIISYETLINVNVTYTFLLLFFFAAPTVLSLRLLPADLKSKTLGCSAVAMTQRELTLCFNISENSDFKSVTAAQYYIQIIKQMSF